MNVLRLLLAFACSGERSFWDAFHYLYGKVFR